MIGYLMNYFTYVAHNECWAIECVCIENMTRNLNNVGTISISLANQSY